MSLRNLVRLAHDTLARTAGQQAVYARGEDKVALTVVRTDPELDFEASEGIVITAPVLGFRIKAADLVIDGDRVKPQPGDRITVVEEAGEETWELLAMGGQPCYKAADPYGRAYKVRAQLIDE